jgi:hypothetical protein
MNYKLIIIICMCVVCSFMMTLPIPDWLKDTFSENIGSHRKIKKKESDCADGDLYMKFKNKHERCIHFDVHDQEKKVYMNQKASDGCLNSEYHVCVPKGGRVTAKGTTHCGGRLLRETYIEYDTLKTHNKDKEGNEWWNMMSGKTENDIIPIRARCVDSYPRMYLNGDKDRYYGQPATYQA